MTLPAKPENVLETVIARGDLARLTPDERTAYYVQVCQSIGVNPMTRPFEYITLNGRLVLYARKDCTDQLRTLYKVSVTELTTSEREGVFVVVAKVANADGRTDAATGAVNIKGVTGEHLANALMKAETKAKRRATLSICGLGFLDETEVEDIPAENKTGKTLPKKDARPVYTRLQVELREQETAELLDKWARANAERIRLLPDDWQDIMRSLYLDRRIELRGGDVADKVVWDESGERPATAADFANSADDGIPPFLDRRGATISVSADEWMPT